MKLVTIPVELTKKTLETEALHESLKATESFLDFGRANTDVTEHLYKGLLETENRGEQISFGSLANGAFERNENYLKWQDGITPDEVDEAWIEDLTNEISAIYGNDKLEAEILSGFDNAGMAPYLGKLVYDPEYLVSAGNEHGMDTILGTLSHEVGHRVVYNLGLETEIDDYENEACADYIAGLTARLCKLDPTDSFSWYSSRSDFSVDGIHPGKSVRCEAFLRGFSRIDRGEEAAILRTFENFSPYDLDKTYQDSEMLKNILYQDIIDPLRSGKIQRV